MYRMTGNNNYNYTEKLILFEELPPAPDPEAWVALSSSYDSNTNFTNIEYKLEMDGTKVGEIIPKVTILATHSDLFGVIKYNSGTS